MDGPDEKEVFYQRKLALIGRILTDLTEGSFDYLNSLQSSKGRLLNILERKQQGIGQEQKKFIDILTNIERHLSLLTQKSKRLYRFGQRLNKPQDSFDPEEVIEESILFYTRLALKRNISLSMKVDEKLPSLYCNSIYFHFIISILIHNMVARICSDGEVTVSAGPSHNGLLIQVKGKGPTEAMISSDQFNFDELWPIGQRLVDNFGGRLQPEVVKNDTKLIDLFVPLHE